MSFIGCHSSDGAVHNSRDAGIKPIILQNIVESLPVGLMVIGSNGEIVTINRAASEILGHSLDVFEGKGWGDLFFDDPKNSDFNQIIIDIICERKVNFKRNVCYTRSDGKSLKLSITGSFLREDGRIAGIVVLMSDVTELHEAHENEKAVLEEKSALQHERAESIRNLAQAVAHQIRNPVTTIGGFSRRVLGRLDAKDPNRGYLETIIDGTRRLENLVTAVSDYTKLLDMKPEPVVMSTVIDMARAGLFQKEEDLAKKVEWSVLGGAIEVRVDPRLFARALNELFLNALEFSRDDPVSIDVQVSKDGGSFTVEVADTGPGISAADRPYIFDPFFTTKAVGVGMGLCRVKRIISEHKGHVTVDSIPGKGTRVTIGVPEGLYNRPILR